MNAIREREVHGEEIVLQVRNCPLFEELIEHDVHLEWLSLELPLFEAVAWLLFSLKLDVL